MSTETLIHEELEAKRIKALVEDKVLEDKTIDYKGSLSIKQDSKKKEFLADVTSFANSIGGKIYYGITSDKEGHPEDIVGVNPEKGIDDIKLSLENILRAGVRPRLVGYDIYPIKIDDKTVLVIDIPRSWVKPHMVVYQEHYKCYYRNSAGKHPMDIDEMRNAILYSEAGLERIKKFREERVSNIGRLRSQELPVELSDKPKTILHLIPMNAFEPGTQIDMSGMAIQRLSPIVTGKSSTGIYNFEGYVRYDSQREPGPRRHYLQVFNNGSIEAVDDFLLGDDEKKLQILSFEKWVSEAVGRFLGHQKNWDVQPPILVMLTLWNVKGYRITDYDGEIRRRVLMIPPVVIESYEGLEMSIFKPMFDRIWQACGIEASESFGSN